MIDYLASFTNTNLVAFPDTEFVNATGPSATDGTEFVKLFGDDIWGARQAIMSHAGLVPDGVTEAQGTAQIIEALQKGFSSAPGAGTEWMNAADPAVTGHRCLLRQGQGILIANYLDLDAAVYVGDGNNATVHAGGGAFYHASDAAGTTPNIAGPYLILDDARGVVPRGLDSAGAIDPDGASRFLGDLQADAMQRITGTWSNVPTVGVISDATGSASGVFSATGASKALSMVGAANPSKDVGFDSSGSTSPNAAKTDDAETRMYNRATNEVIWY